ncbi:hypothetical protein SI65_06685 [Aspergillus cristatus]|uniref:Major facilitator superfamily (MFS) profile domain-containing protein n=1 Tax=Aspergillus cristatus TaxID=573508 RepID=A0A1E3BAC0_ASPCR|nr:hypothetical protein SI65_06685 [Aspergillus cristatus]
MVVIGVFIASGIAAASWVNVGLSCFEGEEVAWRLSLALPVVFSVLLMGFSMCYPESPRWLVSKGLWDGARGAMRVLAGPDADEEVITMEIDDISRTLQQASGAERGFLDLFKPSPERLFQRLCLAIGINFAAQMTGANVISYYGKTIFNPSVSRTQRLPS